MPDEGRFSCVYGTTQMVSTSAVEHQGIPVFCSPVVGALYHFAV